MASPEHCRVGVGSLLSLSLVPRARRGIGSCVGWGERWLYDTCMHACIQIKIHTYAHTHSLSLSLYYFWCVISQTVQIIWPSTMFFGVIFTVAFLPLNVNCKRTAEAIFDLKTALDRAYSVLYDALLTCRARLKARPHKRVTSILREMGRNASSLKLLHALNNCSLSVKIAPYLHGHFVNRQQFTARHSMQPNFFKAHFPYVTLRKFREIVGRLSGYWTISIIAL